MAMTKRFKALPKAAKRAAFANMRKKSKNRGKGSQAYSTMEDKRRRRKGKKAKKRTVKRTVKKRTAKRRSKR